MKEFIVFILFVFIIPFLMDTYQRYRYKFCKQQKKMSFKKCKNWMCKKAGECKFSEFCGRRVYDKPVTGSHEVCQKKYCRHSKECSFYIDNWQRSKVCDVFQDELNNIADEIATLSRLCKECHERAYAEGKLNPYTFEYDECFNCKRNKRIEELRQKLLETIRIMNDIAHSDSSSGAVKDK